MNAKARRAELSRMNDGTNYSYRYKSQLAIAFAAAAAATTVLSLRNSGSVLLAHPQQPYKRTQLATTERMNLEKLELNYCNINEQGKAIINITKVIITIEQVQVSRKIITMLLMQISANYLISRGKVKRKSKKRNLFLTLIKTLRNESSITQLAIDRALGSPTNSQVSNSELIKQPYVRTQLAIARAKNNERSYTNSASKVEINIIPVSYTHLTLPTIYSV